MQAATTTISSSQPPAQQQPSVLLNGIVKQILGDGSVVIRGQPKGGPPPERILVLSSIAVPKLARRPNESSTTEFRDEPYAWQAREYLRKLLVGKQVQFRVEHTIPASGRECGSLYTLHDGNVVNASEELVAQGLADVRSFKGNEEQQKRLHELLATAKAAKKGKWSSDDPQKHIRNVCWTVTDARQYLDSVRGKTLQAVVEHVRDGSTIRVFVLPSFNYVTVMISGIRCPGYKMTESGAVGNAEPYAEEAKFFTESRLLQQDVQLYLEGVSNQNFLGSVVHKNGNIAVALLKEGFARCVDWTIAMVTGGAEQLRKAEQNAKDRRVRLWKSYEPSAASTGSGKVLQAKVSEIVLGDALILQKGDGTQQKVWLSSIRLPRIEDATGGAAANRDGRQFRPLYDIPFMFQTREFLRKKLIGKTVSYTVDYVQASVNQLPERHCCTVLLNDQNVALLLVAKGLATVVRHRQNDENRSPHYDQLLAAEQQAEKAKLGIHQVWSFGEASAEQNAAGASLDKYTVKVQELQANASRSKQFLQALQRAGKNQGIVEFASAGSRLRVFVPKEGILVTLLLSGINCPRPAIKGQQQEAPTPGQTFAAEALQFTKDKCLQRDVTFEVETTDKAGNFIGWCFVAGKNLSELLVDQGLASVHFTADRTKYGAALRAAESRAKAAKLKLWTLPEYQTDTAVGGGGSGDEEDEEVKDQALPSAGTSSQLAAGRSVLPDRVPHYRAVLVTDVRLTPELRFYVQYFDQGDKLEKMMKDLRADFASSPPVAGSYRPKRGELCAAMFSADNQWYRAQVDNVPQGQDKVDVVYIDFGNRETLSPSQLAVLPAAYTSVPAGAKECALALVKLPNDVDYCAFAIKHFYQCVNNEQCMMNTEYKVGTLEYVTLMQGELDIGKSLIRNGYCLTDLKRDRRVKSLLAEYQDAEAEAKKERLNIWEYGDFTGTDL